MEQVREVEALSRPDARPAYELRRDRPALRRPRDRPAGRPPRPGLRAWPSSRPGSAATAWSSTSATTTPRWSWSATCRGPSVQFSGATTASSLQPWPPHRRHVGPPRPVPAGAGQPGPVPPGRRRRGLHRAHRPHRAGRAGVAWGRCRRPPAGPPRPRPAADLHTGPQFGSGPSGSTSTNVPPWPKPLTLLDARSPSRRRRGPRTSCRRSRIAGRR